MQDQRSDVVLNYANNPTGQAPGGFYPGYMGAGVPVLTVREYVQVSGAPIPVYTGIKHTRVQPVSPTSLFGEVNLVGVYAEPQSGPWLTGLPLMFNDVNLSVYVLASRQMTAFWTLEYPMAPTPYEVSQSGSTTIPANTWTRVSFATPNGDAILPPDADPNAKLFAPNVTFVTNGNAAAGDSIILTGAQITGGADLKPYFDGNQADAWWNIIRASLDVNKVGRATRGAGLVTSARPVLLSPTIQARRSNRVTNPRGSLTGVPVWSIAGANGTAPQAITGLNATPTGVSTAYRRTLATFNPASTTAIVSNGTPTSDGFPVTAGETFSAGALFWHSDPGNAYAYANFYNDVGTLMGTVAGVQVPVTPGTAGSAATWLTVKGTVPAGGTYGRVSAGWPANSHPNGKIMGQVLRTNLVTNPRAIGRAFGVAGSTGTQSDVATGGPLGFGYRRYVLATTTTTSPITLSPTETGTASAVVVAGRTYTFSAYARMVGGADPGTNGGLQVSWYNAAGTSLSVESTYQGALVNNVWTRHVKTLVAPVDAAFALIMERFSATSGVPPVGSEYSATGFMVEEAAAVGDYFDGSIASGSGFTTAWVGATNNSVSNMISTGDWLQASSMHYEANRTTDVTPEEYFDGDSVETGNEAFSWTGVAEASISNAVDLSNIAITNLCQNPSFEVDTTGWGVANGFTTVTRTAGFQQMGGKAGTYISAATTTVADRYGTVVGAVIPAKAGKWYGVAAWGACDAATGRLIRVGLQMAGPTIATTYPQTDRPSGDAVWYRGLRWSAAAVAPTGVTSIRPRMQLDAGVGNTLPVGTRLWTDQWLVVEGENALDVNEKMRLYLDGSMPDDPNLVYWWVGAPHASISRRTRYPTP